MLKTQHFKFFAAFLLFFTACLTSKPVPIQFGSESCDHCKMTITDRRFGGELVTPKGKIYRFDSLECLKEFESKHASEKFSVFVMDSTDQGNLISAKDAYFYIAENLRSPMGKGVLVSQRPEKLQDLVHTLTQEKAGQFLRWEETVSKLSRF
jgi:copper chaperone NosL